MRILNPSIFQRILRTRAMSSTGQYPSTIKAIQYTAVGGPEVIKLNDIEFPSAAPNEMLIRVEWAGVNFIDTYYRSGVYPVKSHPAVAGEEMAGILLELPSDPAVLEDPEFKARNFQVGQTVACITGPAFAEYIAKPWHKVLPVPAGIDTRTAAAVPLQALTVLTFIEEAYKAESGDYVLLHAAAGGFGLNMCQILKARGVHVIGSVSTDEKAALAKANGAEFVIVYTKEDLIKRVGEITQGQGAHGIYDGVGKATWEGNFEMIRRKGTIVTFGNASGVVPAFSPMKLKDKNLKVARPVVNNYLITPAENLYYNTLLWDTVKSGVLKANIYKEFPFTPEGVATAQTEQTSGKTTGKLILKVAN
ncbi:hypothetical protein FRC15_009168 [Serendipita sp. 397]|nr:hypothetical protein FRC15_009168 [Serendipita sp. 397]